MNTDSAGTLRLHPSEVTLIYRDNAGTLHDQPLADVSTVGTLIDPDTGADLEIVSVRIVPRSPIKTTTAFPADGSLCRRATTTHDCAFSHRYEHTLRDRDTGN